MIDAGEDAGGEWVSATCGTSSTEAVAMDVEARASAVRMSCSYGRLPRLQ
jgi:hypothetical protein